MRWEDRVYGTVTIAEPSAAPQTRANVAIKG